MIKITSTLPRKSVNLNRTHIFVPAKGNTNKYLYNEVLDIVRDNHLSAEFNNIGINMPSTTRKAISALKALGIKYTSK